MANGGRASEERARLRDQTTSGPGEGVDAPPVPGDQEVADAILHASRVMMAVAVRSLSCAGYELTLPQYRTLLVLACGGAKRLADLAQTLGVSPSTATRMCDRLVRKGLITRCRDELDRREIDLELTGAGRKVVDAVVAQRAAETHALLTAIPVDIRRPLVESLSLLSGCTDAGNKLERSTGWL